MVGARALVAFTLTGETARRLARYRSPIEVGAALELCRRKLPDLIVLDLVMPPASGLALLIAVLT